MLIGFTPRMIVNIRKPGMYVRLVGEVVERVAEPEALHDRAAGPLAHRERLAARHRRRGLLRLPLVLIVPAARPQLQPRRALLLHDVRDLVAHQREIGRLFSRAEQDVIAVRHGAGGQGDRHLSRMRVGMHTHRTGIDTEAAL